MKIRHAKPVDAEAIHETASKSWKDTYQDIFSEKTIEKVISEWYNIESLREQAEDPVFYVAENEGSIVGFVHASVDDGEATLHRIYLEPEQQGKGIGSKLYQKAENDLRDKNAEKIELEVLVENKKGNSFYTKQGFKEVKEETVEFYGEEVKQRILVKEFDKTLENK